MNTDDIEKQIESAMNEAEAAIDSAEKALDPNADILTNRFMESSPEEKRAKAEGIVRQMVSEAMEEERADWGKRIFEAETAAASDREKLLRSMAEFENYKRRAMKDTEERIQRSLSRLLEDFLPLGDNLHRAKCAAQGDQAILDGISMVEQSFYSALAKHDIAPVLSLGCQFDSSIHEALAQQPSDQERGIIVEEFEKGYTWKGKLLRPAKVVVSMGKE